MTSERKHEIQFQTSRGEVTISTNDISDLSGQVWFQEFLGISNPVVRQSQPAPTQSAELQQSQARVQQLEDALTQMQHRMVQMQQMMQPSQPEAPQQPQRPQQQQEPMQPGAPEGNMRAPQANYLDVPPSEMKEDIWEQLTEEQQQRWMSKNGLS